jgi:ribosomal protein L37AE/L43A
VYICGYGRSSSSSVYAPLRSALQRLATVYVHSVCGTCSRTYSILAVSASNRSASSRSLNANVCAVIYFLAIRWEHHNRKRMEQDASFPCTQCGSTELYTDEHGFVYCSRCGVQSQDLAESFQIETGDPVLQGKRKRKSLQSTKARINIS